MNIQEDTKWAELNLPTILEISPEERTNWIKNNVPTETLYQELWKTPLNKNYIYSWNKLGIKETTLQWTKNKSWGEIIKCEKGIQIAKTWLERHGPELDIKYLDETTYHGKTFQGNGKTNCIKRAIRKISIQNAINHKEPEIKDITEVNSAKTTKNQNEYKIKEPATNKGKTLREEWMKLDPINVKDIIKLSPISTTSAEWYQTWVWLEHVIPNESKIWIGKIEEAHKIECFKTKEEWQLLAEKGKPFPNFTTSTTFHSFLQNTANEKITAPARTKQWAKERIIILAENDKDSDEDQRRIITGMLQNPKFEIAYILHTGGKSYHIGLYNNWSEEIKSILSGDKDGKGNRVGGIGFDHMPLTPVQPIRIPGSLNQKTGCPQNLIYLNKRPKKANAII